MIEKDKYNSAIKIISEINSHYKNETLNNALDIIIKTKDEFELKILVVGHFNAGKSSLINSFIERPNFLEEDLGETTALASELRYDQEEKAYSFDKEKKKEPFIKGKKYLPPEYDHISYYLNSRGLKEIEDFVIVDTPGFDTVHEDYSRALTSYLGYGIGFIMVIDVQKGGIDSQTLNYIYELAGYSENIVVLVNKCDKRTESEVNEVVEQIKDTLNVHGFNYPIYRISKYDEEVVQKISSIVSNINAQEKYDVAIRDTLISNMKTILEILKSVSENKYLDTYEYDEIIRIQERKKEIIKKTFQTKSRELTANLESDVENVIQKVKIALSSRSDEAARAIENGNTDGLRAIVLDAVRPVLVESVKEFSIEKISEVVNSFKLNFAIDSNENEHGLDEMVNDVAEKVLGLIKSGAFMEYENSDNEKDNDENSKKKNDKTTNGNAIYTLVTAALSIITGGTVTWMEAIIVLLPEIISGIRFLFGDSNHSKIVKQYEETIIVQVTNSLYPLIKESFNNNIENMMEIFEKEMGNNIDSITQLIENAKNKKADSEEEYNEFMNVIANDIKVIEGMLEEYND